MIPHSPLLNVMIAAAQRAGRGLMRDFNEIENLQTGPTSPDAFVAASIRRCSSVLRRELTAARPDFAYGAADETPSPPSPPSRSAYRWSTVALDGVDDFRRGRPDFAVIIACRRRDEVVSALVFAPRGDDLFVAERGGGAFHNRRRIRASGRRSLEAVAVDDRLRPRLAALSGEEAAIRIGSCCALDFARFAAGQYDAVLRVERRPAIRAAASLLAREAGGLILPERDNPERDGDDKALIAVAAALRRQILEIIRVSL